MSDSVVIIPTYNEIENIEKMVRKVFSLEKEFHLLIIDDNSPDGTAKRVKELQKEFPTQLHLEQREGKLGLGTAYIHGFKWSLQRNYDYIFEMDCDFSHNPDDLIRLYTACKEKNAGLAIGSRYCKGGKVSNWPWDRVLMSYFASIYVRMILWIGIKDTTAGFKCYAKEALQAVNFDAITFRGYAFQICMKYAVKRHKFKIVEVPITFVDRLYGESKMSSGIFKEALFGVWKMRGLKL
ncbi:dolichol-phosphate mannosyltransferase [Lishizhenia tianjinensis]|uniref:Dolichol-phosphate mannosyltransferase n=1 Tax=Lishizhenia tianjinensis TaxID=477690 RepID=A0A1I7A0B5_9FLAO|nr:polyprenol monophosphomannose synthase [Lishizhenia tianjinensis]SFT68365.1 dolichol-phosphate mannosyltransferase [Lishizhenia tianjinensis]